MSRCNTVVLAEPTSAWKRNATVSRQAQLFNLRSEMCLWPFVVAATTSGAGHFFGVAFLPESAAQSRRCGARRRRSLCGAWRAAELPAGCRCRETGRRRSRRGTWRGRLPRTLCQHGRQRAPPLRLPRPCPGVLGALGVEARSGSWSSQWHTPLTAAPTQGDRERVPALTSRQEGGTQAVAGSSARVRALPSARGGDGVALVVTRTCLGLGQSLAVRHPAQLPVVSSLPASTHQVPA